MTSNSKELLAKSPHFPSWLLLVVSPKLSPYQPSALCNAAATHAHKTIIDGTDFLRTEHAVH